jgi:nicotinate dehydrogenase subunit A
LTDGETWSRIRNKRLQDVVQLRISINGDEVDVDADRDTPLLYALRNDLRLKAARFGCGAGSCGACMVLIDGHATPSCDTPLWATDGKYVTTVEGLGDHPVFAALVEEQAGQCGYCLSGMVISAAALLARNRNPTETEVREALRPNLCRCGVHNRVVRAVLRAAR